MLKPITMRTYRFNGSTSYAKFAPITLGADGDSIEFTFSTDVLYNDVYARAFYNGGQTAISLSRLYVEIKDTDGARLAYFSVKPQFAENESLKVRLEYVGGKAYTYVNGTLLYTADAKPLSFNSIGNDGSSRWFWQGEITNLTINGSLIDLEGAEMVDVEIIQS